MLYYSAIGFFSGQVFLMLLLFFMEYLIRRTTKNFLPVYAALVTGTLIVALMSLQMQ